MISSSRACVIFLSTRAETRLTNAFLSACREKTHAKGLGAFHGEPRDLETNTNAGRDRDIVLERGPL